MADQHVITDPNEQMVDPMPSLQIHSTSDAAWTQPAESPSANGTDAPRSFASGSTFLSVKPKIVTEDVFFGEKNMWLRFRAITQEQYRRAQRFCWSYDERTKMRSPEFDKDMNIAFFIEGAIDLNGEQTFNYGQYAQLAKEPVGIINRGATIVARISGMDEDVLGKQRRKADFGAGTSDDEN